MKRETLLIAGLCGFFILFTVSAYLKITHTRGAEVFLTLGMLAILILTAAAVLKAFTFKGPNRFNPGNLPGISFLAMMVITVTGAYLKILHINGADILLATGLVAGLIFIISSLYEIITSKRISSNEKAMWTVGILLMSGVIGIVYLLSGRKRVIGNI